MALAPPVLGIIIWSIICGAVILLVNVAKCGRWINKDNAGIAVVFTITAGISTYLMWVVTWMHQWHPLLPVIMPAKE